MFLSGIADEAGPNIEIQIKAHKELGWNYIEIRNVDGKNLTDINKAKFNEITEKLDEAGIQVCCFASEIANWARKISGDFALDVEELKRAIPRMHHLGTKYIRIMSYPNANWNKSDWRKEVMRRLKKLARIAEDGQVILAHENCSGWGGQGPEGALDIIQTVNSPSLKFLLDTGNKPYSQGTVWDVYQKIREYIAHVHIKDYRGKEGNRFVFPGEGDCQVRKIIKDLLSSGYEGGFSIEPHLASIIHLNKKAEDPETAYRLYLEYGRKAQDLVTEAKNR
ncbi:MAG: TIM barrel protein [Clostridia bacterium]|jgi:sugar phosphate isomerase/epimerase|nr:TIM barrel protein [Clostridia bacterium]